MESKKFHIGDLISVVEGSLVNPKLEGRSHPIDGVYEILNFMSGESLFTHALPRVGNECKPVLLAEYPWLAEITFPGVPDLFRADDINTSWDWICKWLEPIAEKYGEYHEVWPLHSEDHKSIHPLDEPIIQGKNIIEVNIDEDAPPIEGDINW